MTGLTTQDQLQKRGVWAPLRFALPRLSTGPHSEPVDDFPPAFRQGLSVSAFLLLLFGVGFFLSHFHVFKNAAFYLLASVWAHLCHAEVRGQFAGVTSLFPSRGSRGRNSGCQPQQQVTYPPNHLTSSIRRILRRFFSTFKKYYDF